MHVVKRWKHNFKNLPDRETPYLKRESPSLYFKDILKPKLKLYLDILWCFPLAFLELAQALKI